jgi:hypothetical protein
MVISNESHELACYLNLDWILIASILITFFIVKYSRSIYFFVPFQRLDDVVSRLFGYVILNCYDFPVRGYVYYHNPFNTSKISFADLYSFNIKHVPNAISLPIYVRNHVTSIFYPRISFSYASISLPNDQYSNYFYVYPRLSHCYLLIYNLQVFAKMLIFQLF